MKNDLPIEKQETIADIVSEMRIGDLCACDTAARSMYINDFLASYADRIEAAHRREVEELEREAAKDAEIARLRALVKGLLDASSISCADCKYDCYSDHSNCIIHDAANYIEEIEVK